MYSLVACLIIEYQTAYDYCILYPFYKIIRLNWFQINLAMNRIKEVSEQKEIKQTWLAERLGKSYNMVNAYAQNRQQPRLETLMEIANILDIDVKELIVSNKENN